MTRLSKSALLAVVPVMAIAIGLGGCKTAKSPGEICSAQDTFNGLLGIMVPSAKTGSPSIADLSKFVTFALPTVANIDQATKKVDCHAMMTVTGSQGVVSAARGGDMSPAVALAYLSQQQASPDVFTPPVPINDQAADHISFQIAYSVQPTADGNQTVFELDQVSTLSKIVGSAISTMKQESAAQAATAAPPAQPAPAPEAKEVSLTPDLIGGVHAGMLFDAADQALTGAGWKYLTDMGPVDRPIRLFLYQRGSSYVEIDLDNYETDCAVGSVQGYDRPPSGFLDEDGKFLDGAIGTRICHDDDPTPDTNTAAPN